MKALILPLLRVYKKYLSPSLPVACRFVPTCSEYAIEAVEQHGAIRGSWLALRRIARCHPFGGHGYDPVPALGEASEMAFAQSGFRHRFGESSSGKLESCVHAGATVRHRSSPFMGTAERVLTAPPERLAKP